mmetsp:Transcript_5820/g.14903  ORF Transcript_5820/g.14903 Transcript_5820/m.14903 type:complete len:222 (-) Transcript_5820:763-1428(-)
MPARLLPLGLVPPILRELLRVPLAVGGGQGCLEGLLPVAEMAVLLELRPLARVLQLQVPVFVLDPPGGLRVVAGPRADGAEGRGVGACVAEVVGAALGHNLVVRPRHPLFATGGRVQRIVLVPEEGFGGLLCGELGGCEALGGFSHARLLLSTLGEGLSLAGRLLRPLLGHHLALGRVLLAGLKCLGLVLEDVHKPCAHGARLGLLVPRDLVELFGLGTLD